MDELYGPASALGNEHTIVGRHLAKSIFNRLFGGKSLRANETRGAYKSKAGGWWRRSLESGTSRRTDGPQLRIGWVRNQRCVGCIARRRRRSEGRGRSRERVRRRARGSREAPVPQPACPRTLEEANSHAWEAM